MEIIDLLSSFINSTGFPVVCCFLLWGYINTTIKDVTAALNNNTEVLEKLIKMIGE